MNIIDFKLRPWSITDAGSLAEYANNYDIAKNMTNAFPHPYTLADAERFIEMVSKQNPVQVFAIEIEGRASGGIGLFPQTDIYCKNAEMGYWLAEPFWGKGIISRSIKKMVDYGFSTWDINRIYARPYGSNTASQKVLEKSGFKLEARLNGTIYKLGEFQDELIYSIRKDTYKSTQSGEINQP